MITELTSGCSISLVTLTIVKGWLAISWFSANKESSPPNLPNIWVLGMPLFEDLKNRIGLKLLDTRIFKSGVIELTYQPE